MKVKVNKDVCIGCGACNAICEDVFSMDDDGLAKADENKVNDNNKEDVVEASESCPTGAIEVK
jgi:ferredoxin